MQQKRWDGEMNRWHKEIKIMRKQVESDPFKKYRIKHELGYYRKRKMMDCGKTDCMVCHRDKVLGEKTINDKKADKDFKEQLQDMES
jgi:hypothetical protein